MGKLLLSFVLTSCGAPPIAMPSRVSLRGHTLTSRPSTRIRSRQLRADFFFLFLVFGTRSKDDGVAPGFGFGGICINVNMS